MTTLAARRRTVNAIRLSAIYEVRVVRDLATSELLKAPFEAVSGVFNDRFVARKGTKAFARHDRLTDRVTVVLTDGRAFSVEGLHAAGVVISTRDGDNYRIGDPTGEGSRSFAAADVAPVVAPAEVTDAELPPVGAVIEPIQWAKAVLSDSRSDRQWVRFAKAILATKADTYTRPGAWIVPPPVALRAYRQPGPESTEVQEWRPGTLVGHDDRAGD